MAILSLIGVQLRNNVGIAGRMFTVLADGSINIEVISQGSSEINVSCVIQRDHARKALNIVHHNLVRGVVGATLTRVDRCAAAGAVRRSPSGLNSRSLTVVPRGLGRTCIDRGCT